MKPANFRHDHGLLTLTNRFVRALCRNLFRLAHALRAKQNGARFFPRRWHSLTIRKSD
jgi:hypothetical protein